MISGNGQILLLDRKGIGIPQKQNKLYCSMGKVTCLSDILKLCIIYEDFREIVVASRQKIGRKLF